MSDKKYPDLTGHDYLTYYSNTFLSSKEGKEILNKVFKDDHDLKKQITRQIEIHQSIMDKQQPKQQALNNEQPLIPGDYVHIPQNINNRPQPATPVPIVPNSPYES